MHSLVHASFFLIAVVALAADPSNGQRTSEAEAQSLAVAPGQGTFLVLSDIHFNPFANPKLVPELRSADAMKWGHIFDSDLDGGFPEYGQDTNYALLQSVLKAARRYQSIHHYDYVLVTGDYLAHAFSDKYRENGGDDASYAVFVVKTMTFLSRMIEESFPSLPVYAVLGNNDSICGDYRQSPGDELLRGMAEQSRVFARVPEAKSDFAVGGFYAVPHPTVPNEELIVLNTTFWSNFYEDGCSMNAGSPGKAELKWLAWKLYQARAQKKTVSLLMHIPPGIDAYQSAQRACDPAPLWKAEFASEFDGLIEEFRELFRDVYVGHLHMDDFRLFEDSEGAPFAEAHVVPAVSPVYRNNPAFEIALYDKHSGYLVNYAIVYLTNLERLQKKSQQAPTWSVEYSADTAYRLREYGPHGAKEIAEAIRSDSETRQRFARFYNVMSSATSPVSGSHWLSFSCAQTELSEEGYKRCSCAVAAAPKE
jgi:sphingomyelin phosphodiesterase acid-like 3